MPSCLGQRARVRVKAQRALLGLIALALLTQLRSPSEHRILTGRIVGQNAAAAHAALRLRQHPDGRPLRPSRNLSQATLDVVIVGGGIAGLVAARKLHERGVAFLLLEQESDVGGNARSGGDGPDGVRSSAALLLTVRGVRSRSHSTAATDSSQ